MGDEQERQVLYLAAISATRHNVARREFHVQLRQTGQAKQAMAAVANKSFCGYRQ
jgi:hypothetical protein